MESSVNKKNIFLWSLYDFAKAFTVITFSLYFSQWLVVENKVPDIWYNLIFVGASFLLLFTAPILAIIADKKNQSLPFLRLMAFMLFLTTLACSLFAMFSGPHFVLWAAISYLFSNYFYQFSLVFYNGFLPQLAPPKKQGFVSGLGYTANWLGDIAGILISLPFAAGVIYWFGHPGRVQTLLPSTLLFGIFALPMLLFFRETKQPTAAGANIKAEYKNLFRSFINLCKQPGLGRFLLGYFLFNDAILTLENNYAIYLQKVYHANDQTKSFLLLALLIASTVGAFASGWAADRIGLKKSLVIIIFLTFLLLPVLALAKNFNVLYAFTALLGLGYGAVWVVARAVLAYLAPGSRVNHAFSYYTLMERFATFVGPVAWGLTLLFLKNHEIFGYRFAVIIMALFVFLGAMIMKDIPSDKNFNQALAYGTSRQ
jgi:UMF1 family MFS transporter